MDRTTTSARSTLGHVYALSDPGTLQPRYVGRTAKTVEGRFSEHLYHAANLRNGTHRDCWIRDLAARGLRPLVETLESGVWTYDELNLREMYWISGLRTLGARLTNHSDGGDGSTGTILSEATKTVLRDLAIKHWEDADARAAHTSANRQIWESAELRARTGEKTRAQWKDPDCKARTTLASAEYRARRSNIAKKNSSTEAGKSLLSSNGKTAMRRRRKCAECSYTGAPAHVGTHQRFSTHVGHVDLSPDGGGDRT